jgi:hypothetical protein
MSPKPCCMRMTTAMKLEDSSKWKILKDPNTSLVTLSRYEFLFGIGRLSELSVKFGPALFHRMRERQIEAALRQRVALTNTQLDRYQKIRKIAVISNDFAEQLRSLTALQRSR